MSFSEPREIKMEACEALAAIYLDYFNNYLTVEKFAEHNGLHENEAETLINLGREVANRPHPET